MQSLLSTKIQGLGVPNNQGLGLEPCPYPVILGYSVSDGMSEVTLLLSFVVGGGLGRYRSVGAQPSLTVHSPVWSVRSSGRARGRPV